MFLNDFLHQQRGLSVERATVVVALFGVGSFVGQVVGAVVGQQAYNRSSALQPLLMGVRADVESHAWLLYSAL